MEGKDECELPTELFKTMPAYMKVVAQ